MAAAMEAVELVDDLDCDIFDFDIIKALDLDLSSSADSSVTDDGSLAPAAGVAAAVEAMSAYVAELELFLLDDDAPCGEQAEGLLGGGGEAMSAYVAELERFLLDDDAPCGEQAEDLLGVVDDYFVGDQLVIANAEVVPAAGRVESTADAHGEEEENDNVLAALEDE